MTDRQWSDAYARHMVDTELYAEARAALAGDMLRRLNRELRGIIASYGTITGKAREAECRKECDECIKRYLDEWREQEEEERQSQAEREAEWLASALKAALGITVMATAAKIRRALEAPFSETDAFGSLAEDIGSRARKAVRTPLLSARIFGSGGSAVSESIDSAFAGLERDTRVSVRTSVTALQRNVQRRLLEDKRRLRFKYISMLDDRVCVVCGGYSGKVFEDLSEAPAVPVHIRCRCYYLPIISSSDDDGKEETYQEWFDRQPDSVQYKILGPTRYAFYKSGITHIERFTSEGRKLTLDELFKNNNMASISSGARSKIINELKEGDLLKRNDVATVYYNMIRKGDNTDFITRIAKNSGKSYGDVEQIIDHIFKSTHKFEDGRVKRFDPSPEIVEAFERLKTGEYTDSDILLLDHELLELTYMKNKKYNIYEVAHHMANLVYNWQEVISNEDVSKKNGR